MGVTQRNLLKIVLIYKERKKTISIPYTFFSVQVRTLVQVEQLLIHIFIFEHRLIKLLALLLFCRTFSQHSPQKLGISVCNLYLTNNAVTITIQCPNGVEMEQMKLAIFTQKYFDKYKTERENLFDALTASSPFSHIPTYLHNIPLEAYNSLLSLKTN